MKQQQYIKILIYSGILWCILLLGSCNYGVYKQDDVQKALEYGYFQGQQGALTGDIRIKKVDSQWVWIRSPWNDSTVPLYNPAYSINQNFKIK